MAASMRKCNICSILHCAAMAHRYCHLFAEDRALIIQMRASHSPHERARKHVKQKRELNYQLLPLNGVLLTIPEIA
ncbi:hypothetical protein SAMN02745148_01692 [Modicisalibacter ilicicola DSM 19980]|uniref:Uncharacterized protein n=1 Tax=Modicisalibacter ilicicola DSM 19980 TaxID=1121942 RepID=A0A1M4YF20_9GAMM|nr:hypothetical protein SAMN02745148_01692 [Halomonas ilicicola DSM 19980]